MSEAADGTVEGMQAFLDWAREKGEMNASTAQALKSTVGKVVEVADDGTAAVVANLDVENLLSRWETKNKTKYKVDTLNTYKVRFRQAVALYGAWLANDPDWKSASKTANSDVPNVPRQRSSPASSKKTPRPSASRAQEPPSAEPPVQTVGTRLVSYDLPLRPDLLVRLNLPVDLTPEDASRISAFVSSLAFSPTQTVDASVKGSGHG
ncbi:MAG: hypothetical protein QM611_01250 [Microbacterium sp.]|uniref:hypothetical protein n=1 Tax=Microbacterium sp. TaxID=51671 RepID=UPI0039E5BD7A